MDVQISIQIYSKLKPSFQQYTFNNMAHNNIQLYIVENYAIEKYKNHMMKHV